MTEIAMQRLQQQACSEAKNGSRRRILPVVTLSSILTVWILGCCATLPTRSAFQFLPQQQRQQQHLSFCNSVGGGSRRSGFATQRRRRGAGPAAGDGGVEQSWNGGRVSLAATGKGGGGNKGKSARAVTEPAEFEFQELKANVQGMLAAGIPSRDLQPTKRFEMEAYAREVARKRPSPVRLTDIGRLLPGTNWTLAFSTASATLGDLPRDATVKLQFLDDIRMDYVLDFSPKTFGLKRLVAKCKWYFNNDSPSPRGSSAAADAGLVTFVYDEITTDVFGLTGLGVGFFGLLKGRANYVESAYFDGIYWIERGIGPSGGEDFVNVYVRDKEE